MPLTAQSRAEFAVAPARVPPMLAQYVAGVPDGDAASALAGAVAAGLDRLPLPGSGATLARWQALSIAGGHDLSFAKLYEGHTDALAILAELQGPDIAGATWGVWCAEPPGPGVALRVAGNGRYTLSGRKQWCSGAAALSHALVSCRDAAGRRMLAAVSLRQPGVEVTNQGWHAVGMAGSASVDVVFTDAQAVPVGEHESYLTRPGFWMGGAGVAACWYGAARAIGERLLAAAHAQTSDRNHRPDPHRLAHLGNVDIALSGAAALLLSSAANIDAHPRADHCALALRLRLTVEAAATTVLAHANRALGAGPLCRDAQFAHLAADLPVFLRQSHAERDLATLGSQLANTGASPWAL
ncbi:alkylation response protein AidB-like acyl-CoA dehydrogenase [Duganella sp. 3397]|uniref:acyl-CoA dehydrogenase family protein n=1 Tax=Duganella sp. 3397 TaxID=2817732 RepID=UPI0028679982|nr:alkylation response protein AidB-like acyl-CoA dehydrogenase [Duganella sp. 3397]